MNPIRPITALACVLPIGACGTSPMADWPAIKAELEALHKSDQELRQEHQKLLSEARTKGVKLDKQIEADIWKRIGEQDKVNQRRVAEIVDAYGWPGKTDVGSQAATGVFLVVQHAEAAFQQRYLDLMRKAAMSGEASKQNFALPEDRLLLRTGKPQRYGSQVNTKDGVTLLPVEDEANLDARRNEMELPPVCTYLAYFVKAYGKVTYPPCLAKTG
jgi:hypothetical protein